MKFDFSKSIATDLQNKITLNKFEIINKNLLYVTHAVDRIEALLETLVHDKNLQKQVDDYFEEDKEHIPEEDKEPD